MRTVPFAAAACAFVIAVTACSNSDDGQDIAVLAGGGDDSAAQGTAIEMRLDGLPVDMAVTADETVHVLALPDLSPELWTIDPSGEFRRQPVTGLDEQPEQMAVAADGTVYVSAGRSVWRVADDGTATRIAGTGEAGFAPDGTPAAGARLGTTSGVAVDPDGRVLFTEHLTDPEGFALVRRIGPDGLLETVVGTREVPDEDSAEFREAFDGSMDPPPGSRAEETMLYGVLPRPLAVGADGRVYVSTRDGVIAVDEDGTASPVIAGRDPDAVASPEEPRAVRGAALDARIQIQTGPGGDLAVGGDGSVFLTYAEPGSPPEAFQWTGLSGGADEVAASLFAEDEGFRLDAATPDGELTTVAYRLREVASGEDGTIYGVAQHADAGALIVRLPSQS